MKYIKRNDKGTYRGKAFVVGTILMVGPALYDSLILNGKGTASTKEEYEKQKALKKDTEAFFEMTEKELKEIDYKSLNKKSLEAYAIAVGIAVEKIDDAKNMNEMKALIKEKLGEE